jgi:subtilase family serine protease
MKRSSFVLLTGLVIILVAIGGFAQDQSSTPHGRIVLPPSSLNRVPGRPHTPLLIFIPDEGVNVDIPNGETPASIACIYGVTAPTPGCPKNGTVLPTGGTKAIAVVDFGRNATLQNDLNTFNSHFGLPPVTITEICTPGPPPCPDNSGSGWDLETALDVEWAHAMAPNAAIIEAEFTTDPLFDNSGLCCGDGTETAAASYIATHYGSGDISNSFTYFPEFSTETSGDSEFQQAGIVYFGSAGDSGLGPAYPSVSPYVISAGGTRISRDSNGNFTTESCWSGSGGGLSAFESRPSYEHIISNLVGSQRGTPDLAADASPASGVLVYSTTGCGGWCIVGGTSVSSPVLAGIVNQTGSFLGSTNAELTKTYG